MSAWRYTLMLALSAVPPVAAAQEPLRDVRSYGAAEFSDESIRWVTVSDRGRVVIAQDKTNRLYFYAPEGNVLGTFGRSGDGPGEFRLPLGEGWVGDTLWVNDM